MFNFLIICVKLSLPQFLKKKGGEKMEGLFSGKSIANSAGDILGAEFFDGSAALYAANPGRDFSGKTVLHQARIMVERTDFPAIYFALGQLALAIDADNCRIGTDQTGGRRLLHFDATWPEKGSHDLEGNAYAGGMLSWMIGGVDEAFCFYVLGTAPDAMIEMWIKGPPYSPLTSQQVSNMPKICIPEDEMPTVYRAFIILAHAVLSDQELKLYRV